MQNAQSRVDGIGDEAIISKLCQCFAKIHTRFPIPQPRIRHMRYPAPYEVPFASTIPAAKNQNSTRSKRMP